MINKLKILLKSKQNKMLYILLVLFFFNVHNSFGLWQTVNTPTGGRINSFLKYNGGILAAVYGSGIFRSTDEGANWSPVTKGNSNLPTTINLLADANYLFSETYNLNSNGSGPVNLFELYRSSDNGKNWERIHDGKLGNKSFIFVNEITVQNSVLYICSDSGLIVSTNSGTTWTNKSIGLTSKNVWDVYYRKDTLYLGTDDGLYISTNNGDSWVPKGFPNFTVYKIFEINKRICPCIYDSTRNSTAAFNIYESREDGSGFRVYREDLFKNYQIFGISELNSEIIINTIQIVGSDFNSRIFYTSNTGIDWTLVYDITTNGTLYTTGAVLLNTKNIFAGMRFNGIMKSTDKGLDWSYSNNGIFLQVTSMTYNSTDIYAATLENGIFHSTDNGTTWSIIPSSPQYSANYYISVNKLVTDNANIFACTASGLYISSDDGLSWTSMGIKNYNIIDMVVDNNKIHVVANVTGSQSGYYFVSTDYGKNWSVTPPSSLFYFIAELFSSLFIGSADGLLKSIDGNTWTNIYPSFNQNKSILSMTYIKNQLLAGSYNGIYRSNDSGSTWNELNQGLTTKRINNLYKAGSSVFCASDSGVFITLDRGISWNKDNSGLNSLNVENFMKIGNTVYTYLYRDQIYKAVFTDFFPILISNIPNTIVCSDMALTINYTISNSVAFNNDNLFIAELSDETGEFGGNNRKLDSIQSTASGSINVVIPKNIPFGTKYRIRIVSTSPKYIGVDNQNDITILNRTIPAIKGSKSVCEGESSTYSITPNPGYNYKWIAVNGIITGDNTQSTVTVNWDSQGMGNLKIIQESIALCSDTSSINVVIHAKPATPVIAQQDSTFTSNSGYKYQWFSDGILISGATNQSYKAFNSGTFYVQITNEFGCTSDNSNSIFFDASGDYIKFQCDDITGTPGDIINLNLELVKSKKFSDLNIKSFSVRLVMDASLLYPVDLVDKGTISDKKRYITLDLGTDFITGNIVKTIRLEVMLGDALQTPVILDNIKSVPLISDLKTLSFPGTFTLKGVCIEGGPRLITSSGEVLLSALVPNPATDEVKVIFGTLESGSTKLYICNTLGEIEKELLNKELTIGNHEMTFSLKGIMAGNYYLVMQTQTLKIAAGLVITK